MDNENLTCSTFGPEILSHRDNWSALIQEVDAGKGVMVTLVAFRGQLESKSLSLFQNFSHLS